MAAHSKLGASGSHRWFKCSGSVVLSEGRPNESSVFAMEGTAAHFLGETCLRAQLRTPEGYLGWSAHVLETPKMKEVYLTETEDMPKDLNPKFVHTFEVTEEMVEAVQTYLDAIWNIYQPDDILVVEQKFDLSSLFPGMFGTADCVIYRPSTGELFVFDFKYGQGVPVDVKGNEQQLFYSLGAALHTPGRNLTDVEMAIVQPRCFHPDGPVRSWKISAVDLLDWSADLIEAAERTDVAATEYRAGNGDPDWFKKWTCAGDHCKWCPASPCMTVTNKAYEDAKAEFSSAGEIILPSVPALGGEELARVLRNADFMENWIKAVRAFAHHEGDAGRPPPGFKIVAKRATRKFKDPETAKTFLIEKGIAESELYKDPIMKTPAMVETLVKSELGLKGKAAKEFLADLCEAISTGTTLVPVEDSRPPVKAEAADEFTAFVPE